MTDQRSPEAYQTHFAQRRQIEEEQAREVAYFRAHEGKPNGPESCRLAGHVPGCPGRAGGDHELLPGWISYEDEDGHTVEIEVSE